jgi:ParB family chromosome partitioning protein
MAFKMGLGKGLDSMIPEQYKDENTENVSQETMIHISNIEPNKSQPRRKFDEDSLRELADSIKQYGVIQPLILQKKDQYYEIIAGERRWRAARIAGLKEVPAIIKDYSPQEIVEIALIENIQREDLNPIEEALTY